MRTAFTSGFVLIACCALLAADLLYERVKQMHRKPYQQPRSDMRRFEINHTQKETDDE